MLLLRIFSLLSVVISIVTFNYFQEYFRYFIFLPLTFFVLLIRNAKSNIPLVLFYIYGFLFYLYLLPKFLFDFPIVYYFTYDHIYFYNKTLLINIIFLGTLGSFIKPFRRQFTFPDYSSWFQGNDFIVAFNAVIMILILIFGLSGNSILSDAKYGTADFGEKSILTEYFIIFLIFAYSHSKTALIKWTVITIAAIMVLKCLMYGSRISAILIMLTTFLLHFANRFSVKKIIILAFSGLIVMNVFGALRSNSSGPIQSISLLRIKTDGIMSSTQSNMYYGSVSFVGLVENDVFDTTTRLKSIIGFISRLFLPSSLTLEEGSLAPYGQKLTRWGGGALPATYFYVWFGWAGPIFFGAFIALLINKLKSIKNNKYSFFMIIILLATFPRWYGYEPGVIFKMTWVGIVILIIQENLFFKLKSKK